MLQLCTRLRENALVFSQSEARNFFMCIITPVSVENLAFILKYWRFSWCHVHEKKKIRKITQIGGYW